MRFPLWTFTYHNLHLKSTSRLCSGALAASEVLKSHVNEQLTVQAGTEWFCFHYLQQCHSSWLHVMSIGSPLCHPSKLVFRATERTPHCCSIFLILFLLLFYWCRIGHANNFFARPLHLKVEVPLATTGASSSWRKLPRGNT